MLSARRAGAGGAPGKTSHARPCNPGYPRRSSVPMTGGDATRPAVARALRLPGSGGGAGFQRREPHRWLRPCSSSRSGDGAAAVLASRSGSSDMGLGVSSFSPCSLPRRVDAPRRRPVWCSPAAPPPPPPPRVEVQSVRKRRMSEEWEALKAAIADMFRPLLRNLADICSLRSAYDFEDYQIGMLFGAFLGYVGCYQLWKAAPSVFVDAALAFVFYKLSVVSSELHRQRKTNSLITRLKFGTILIMVMKDIKKNYVLLDIIRMPVFFLYICAFVFDVAGMKKYARRSLISLFNLLKSRGGIQEIYRIMWYPGYISPYDDSADW
ncbi:hypothetical protein OsJ_29875 [Oryza sativa Japonica Group]|uniref:Uncharacterized protein n=1 Tax=Oryza sativa subsp. japonica TaxID=39947 RepID=B9G4D0_ORYSJ|nr:hypothetical protein OsJ_29875 [Oryza sativa Japonica Group]